MFLPLFYVDNWMKYFSGQKKQWPTYDQLAIAFLP